uniref:WD_REPEATS_REGION domain-containing protein n=1 Tax=Elaeophora elaphi TaxID=1147741 RepID=A0A0R3RWD7_9BILA
MGRLEMTEALSLMYGIDLPARSIVGLPAEQERTLFLVGTLSLKQDNQVCLLEVDDDWLQITKRSFNHPAGEIWCISSSPVDSSIIATCYVAWVISSRVEFHPSGNKVAIAINNSVLLADVTNSLKVESSILVDGKTPIGAAVWNPHSNGSNLAVAYDTLLKGVDVRSLQESFCIKHVNSPRIRNLDFNPNVQHIVATCGDDFKVVLWDIRKVDVPLKVLQDHSHWVWCVKFNPIHDQLLLSAGSDARLFLNSLESLSSESIHSLALVSDDSYSSPENILGDERLEKMEEHEESVYSCAWAGNDPWVFASVSFDGRVIVSKVKRHHKYAILRL